MKKTQDFQLKKPFLVWFIGCCFILAGPANVVQVLLLEHASNWYEPSAWLALFSKMPLLNQIICASLPVAGVSLLFQRKNSWLLAVTFVLGACVQNLYTYLSSGPALYPVYISMAANASVLVVFYYFRFPYLDRRDQFLRGFTKRYSVNLPVQVDAFTGVVATSLSAGGCYLKFKPQTLPALHSVVRIQMGEIKVDGVVSYHQRNACGIRFKNRLSKAQVRQLIDLSASTPAKGDRRAA